MRAESTFQPEPAKEDANMATALEKPPPATLRQTEFARRLGISLPTFKAWLRDGRIPPPLPIPGKKVWRLRDVQHLI
jgi:hypothetical protein